MLETHNPDLAQPEKLPLTLAPETLAQLIESNTESRPWGSFTVLEEGPGYKIKRIVVLPKHRLSLQLHYHRSEHWIVVAGTAKVTCGDEEKLITSNQSTYVPPCTKHRLENPGVIPLVIIEVQNGQYLGEDDIVRFSDDYARVNGSQPQKA
ncbi:MAG: phosphomannose isomerase type II C-terminal cupin domain [Thermostichus sp. HHBFW_bins_43]